jgi:hypothetical protein
MSVASPSEHAVDATRPRRWQHARVIARLATLYATFDVLKHVVPLPALVRWAWRRPTGPRDRTAEDRVLRCMVRLRRWLPADRGDCLHGSLALYRALSATGSSPRLVVGFRKDAPAIAGHAWVEVDGVAQLEVPPETAGFVAAFEFGDEGVRRDRAAR